MRIAESLAELARRAADFAECINLEHRFEAAASEFELQRRSRALGREKELLAAIVFRNLPTRQA